MVDGSIINHEQVVVVKESNGDVTNGVISSTTTWEPW